MVVEPPSPNRRRTVADGHQLASAIMFVHSPDRSVAVYQELLALNVTVQDNTAALLVSSDGYQLYLRSMGADAVHPLGGIGVQYLIWTADGEDDLRRCEGVLRAHSAHVSSQVILEQNRAMGVLPLQFPAIGHSQLPRTPRVVSNAS
ncbi:MAG: hypothetical protein ACRDTV_06455 [Mycobacterium sp.]